MRANKILRKAFNSWLFRHQEEEAIDEANDHGQARLDLIKATQDVRNLRDFAEATDRWTEKDLNIMLNKNEKAYQQKAEQVMCRMFTYGDLL